MLNKVCFTPMLIFSITAPAMLQRDITHCPARLNRVKCSGCSTGGANANRLRDVDTVTSSTHQYRHQHCGHQYRQLATGSMHDSNPLCCVSGAATTESNGTHPAPMAVSAQTVVL